MQRNTLLAAVLAVLTVTTVAVGVGMAATGTGASSTDTQTVAVAGSGEVDASPDAAVVRLSVTARGPNAANVSDEIAAGASQLRETLADFGVPEDDVQTQHYNIHQDRQPDSGNGDPVYMGEQSFAVTLDDVDEVGSLIDAAVDGGADDVGGVRYTLSSERRDEVRNDAIRAAVEDARGEAAVIADSTNLQLGGVQRAASRETSVSPYHAEVAMAADAGGGTTVDPQDVTVSATVEVTFAATTN